MFFPVQVLPEVVTVSLGDEDGVADLKKGKIMLFLRKQLKHTLQQIKTFLLKNFPKYYRGVSITGIL